MRFLCLICAEKMMEEMPPADATRHFEEYAQFTAALRESGQLVACNRLLPPDTATTVRVRGGRALTTDGPYAETKEQLGGFYIVQAKDREEAIGIAARIPGARLGCVEIRPIADDEPTRRALEPPDR